MTQRLPPVVKSLGFVSLFNDLASEMVYPLIPALVTALGGGAMSLGMLDGIADAISAGAKLAAGRLADRTGLRRVLVIAGYVIAAVTRPVIGVAGRAWQIVALRATDRIGKGVRSPARDAVIADATSPEMRGRAFGYHRAMDHAGAVAGPLVAWFLLTRVGLQPAQVIIWSVIPGLVAVGAVFVAMKQPGGGKGEEGRGMGEGGRARSSPTAPTISMTGSPKLAIFYLIVLFGLLKFPETLLLLRLQDLGTPVAATPLAWAGLHVIRTSTSYSGGKLSDRFGTGLTMGGGWIVYAVACAGLAMAGSVATGIAWFLTFGLVSSLTESPERAFVANLKARIGTGGRFGAYHAATGVAALIGGLVFGFVYSRFGGPAALLASASGAGLLVATAVLTGKGKAG